MRTWFEPEETEEYEATRNVLIRRCLTWADEHGRPADDLLLAAALDARHHSRDGRLAYWDEHQIRRYLLAWIPKYVVTPREIVEIAPEILRTFLHYLSAAGLRDPRGATPAEADDAITRALPDFRKALDDPSLLGLAKFWAQTALDHGNDLAGPGALRDFQLDLDAGRIRYDQELLGKLLEARFTRTEPDLEEERDFLQPPVELPAPADLAVAAARSTTVRRLGALAGWAGEVGRPSPGRATSRSPTPASCRSSWAPARRRCRSAAPPTCRSSACCWPGPGGWAWSAPAGAASSRWPGPPRCCATRRRCGRAPSRFFPAWANRSR
ncbi:hypothetical protein ACFQ0B_73375 [Nonomuraea thailandensis]